MAEIDLLAFFVIFIHRDIDDPAEFEGVFFADVHVLRDFGAGGARHFRGFQFFIADEENGIAVFTAGKGAQFNLRFGADETCDGAFASACFEGDIPQPRRAELLCPIIQLVEKAARAVGNFRSANGADDAAFVDRAAESAEFDIGAQKD